MSKSLQELNLTPKRIALLKKLELDNSEAILSYYPFRYEQITLIPFSDWQKDTKIAFEARLISYPKSFRYQRGKTMTKFMVENEDGEFKVTIFNRPWMNSLKLNSVLTILGKYEGNYTVMASQYNTKPLSEQLALTPVYPLKDVVSQKELQTIITKTWLSCKEEIVDFIPEKYREKYRLLTRKKALSLIHFPNHEEDIKQAVRTLKYEEFLRFQLVMHCLRMQEKQEIVGIKKSFDVDDVFRLANSLAFNLSNDQIKAINDILEDLQSDKVMYRLIQGDVGCGKTLVASMALYGCVLAHKQGAMMAPTEILAKQHYASLKQLFRPTKIRIEVLYSALPNANKKAILTDLKAGLIDILVGTHSLIQNDVEFNDLGLVVADEQHRFGVEQRRKLKEKGKKVDFLLMSATPIPRTLANSIYGDMDISTIYTMPTGRKKIETHLVLNNSLQPLLPQIYEKLDEGRQCYIVCPAIEESETIDLRNVNQVYESLLEVFKGKYTVNLLHGKMNSDEKEKVMAKFEANETQVLVTTTVIEVGVNVVNATCMVIYDAHRFGLSQLHQLRGRVARGNQVGTCYLLTNTTDPDSLKRLQVIENTSDGFEIAYEDLKIRGPGDLLGTRQSGIPTFNLANIIEDSKILVVAKTDALEIIEDLNNPSYDRIRKMLKETNLINITYID